MIWTPLKETMSTSPKPHTAKMRLPLKKLRKFFQSWRTQPPTDSTSAKVITTTVSPLLLLSVASTYATPPPTFPASSRSGRSDASLPSPRMEKSTSGSSGVTTRPSTLSTTLEESESSEQTRSQGSKSQERDNGASLAESFSGKPEPPAVPSKDPEPEVPDPFLVDDSDSDEDLDNQEASSAHDVEISFAQPSESTPVIPLDANVHNAVPPPERNDNVEEEAPDLYLPNLIIPTLFLPIPNVRLPLRLPFSHLIWWLSRVQNPRSVHGICFL